MFHTCPSFTVMECGQVLLQYSFEVNVLLEHFHLMPLSIWIDVSVQWSMASMHSDNMNTYHHNEHMAFFF